ncbi:MAG: phosphatase PAP2 family protein [Thermoanaerobaculia bacterium]
MNEEESTLAESPPRESWWVRALARFEPHERIAAIYALGTLALFAAFGFRASWRWVAGSYAGYLIFVSKAVVALWLPLWIYRLWRRRTTAREGLVELLAYARGAIVLLIVTTCYTHLKARKLDLNPRLFDEWLWRADNFLFAAGGNFIDWVQRHNQDRTWTMAMERLYLQSGLALGVPLGLAFGWRGRIVVRRAFAALVLCYALGSLLYIAFPALGPAFFRREAYSHLSWTQTFMGQNGMLQGLQAMVRSRDFPVIPFAGIAAFPSLHVGIAFLGFLIAWTYIRPVAYFIAPVVVCIGVSAVWFGWHYVVDFPAGILLALFCWWAAGKMIPDSIRSQDGLASVDSVVS